MTFAHDVFGNSVATAHFNVLADRLTIDCVTQLSLEAAAWPVFDVAASAIFYPFRYSDDERTDLGALMFQQYADPNGRLRDWAWAFVRGAQTDTLALLKDLGVGVSAWIKYQSREDEGVQSPIQTLDRGWGSCRDFAVLFIEAARCLGFGARIVSGYLHGAEAGAVGSNDAGSTHAWAEIYIPGAGWITFDPTNRSFGGYNLIPVAVARDIRLAMPVAGVLSAPATPSSEWTSRSRLRRRLERRARREPDFIRESCARLISSPSRLFIVSKLDSSLSPHVLQRKWARFRPVLLPARW